MKECIYEYICNIYNNFIYSFYKNSKNNLSEKLLNNEKKKEESNLPIFYNKLDDSYYEKNTLTLEEYLKKKKIMEEHV